MLLLVFLAFSLVIMGCFKGLFTWREEDPSTRKILEGETNFFALHAEILVGVVAGKQIKLSVFSS